MANMRKRTVSKPSNWPYVVIGVEWAILTLLFPMYRFSSYLILALIGVISYIALRRFHVFRDVVIEYEEEIPYEEWELQEVIQEGERYLNELRACNDAIADPVISKDIDAVVNIAAKILDKVKQDPKNRKDIRKFISFYLPTLSRLLRSYVEMDGAATLSDQAGKTKEKIANMLKTVEEAFIRQYDALFEEEAIDVSADIRVLKSMMAQEGFINQEREETR